MDARPSVCWEMYHDDANRNKIRKHARCTTKLTIKGLESDCTFDEYAAGNQQKQQTEQKSREELFISDI